MKGFAPGYLGLYKTGALRERIQAAVSILRHCELCPRRCGVNPDIKYSDDESAYRPLARLHRELGFNGWIQSIYVMKY
jgi:hypothetical protein